MQPQLEVDERLLHSVAKSVDDAAATLRAAVTAAGSGPVPPPGSAAAAAARTAEQTWLADLGRLQRDTETFAADLVAAANGYLASDQAGAAELRAAGTGVPR